MNTRLNQRSNREGGGVRPREGFTLVELLVVVSIIALLVGMLLPSMSKARKQAQAVTCLSRDQQLGVGMTLYVSEYDVYPPHQLFLDVPDPEYPDPRMRMRWYDVMANELNTTRRDKYLVQSCPTVHGWKVGRNNSYGYNYKYLGSYRVYKRPADPNLVPNPYDPYERFPVKNLRNPSATIAFADSDGTGWTKEHANEFEPLDQPAVWKDKYRLGNHGYILDPTYVPIWSKYAWSGAPPNLEQETYSWKNWRTYLSDRHLGKSAGVFADGHGEMVDPRVAYRDNSMWNGLGFDPALKNPENPDILTAGEQDTNHPLYNMDPHEAAKLDSGSGQLWRYN